MKPSVLAGRIAYRLAHRALRMYWFIARPEINGVKCVITDRDRVLLVRHTYGRGEWDLPGGGMKRSEPATATARREIEEELGVRVDEWRSLGAITARVYRGRDTIHCFQAELREPTLTIDEVELSAARWFRRAELPRDLGRHARKVISLVDGGTYGAVEKDARPPADSGAAL